jgi:hypothetical protein
MTAGPNVLLVDLASMENKPQSYHEVLKLGASEEVFPTNGENIGILRLKNLLIVDTLDGVFKNQVFYESVLRSPSLPKVILLVSDCYEEPSGSQISSKISPNISLPKIFEDRSSDVRVILMTSRTGTFWAPENVSPDGVAMWSQDPDGAATLGVIVESLRLGEIFEECFRMMAKGGLSAWSIGTKQVWFGSLPPRQMADVLEEVARGFIGERFDYVGLKEVEQLKVDKDLIGLAVENEVLDENGRILRAYAKLKELEETFSKNAGIRNQSGKLSRIINFPHRTIQDANNLRKEVIQFDEGLVEFIVAVDPSDGFSQEEHTIFKKMGINVYGRGMGQEKFSNSDIDLMQTTLAGMEKALRDGHGFIPIKILINDLLEVVVPRSSEEVLHGIENFQESIFARKEMYQDFEFGYDGVSFAKVVPKIDESLKKCPKSPIIRIAKLLAKVVNRLWTRALLAFLYTWALAVAAFEAFDQGRTNGFVPLPLAVRQSVANVVVVAFVISSILLIIAGLILNEAHVKILRWGKTFGIHDSVSGERLARNKEFLSRVAFNEWVLWNRRTDIAEQLKILLITIEKMEVVLQSRFIDDCKGIEKVSKGVLKPNPMVQQDFNEYSATGFYAQLEEVRTILRGDVMDIIMPKLKARSLELKGKNHRSEVPHIIEDDISGLMENYVMQVVSKGVLSKHSISDVASAERRRILNQDYWNRVEGIDVVIRKIVGTGKLDPIVQLVRPQDLGLLKVGVETVEIIRFTPHPSKDKLETGGGIGGDIKITYTEAVNGSGIIRLVGFREGVVTYSDPSDSSESLEP